jgi:MYXO-CTERM domain-containing protein/uncharacterized repeat protein (TIGR01451 family)
VALSGPNNPENNFFCSQINDGDGNLDMTGSFGDVNHDAANETNVIGGRQGWDITRLGLSSGENHFSNGQTTAVLRARSTDDSYFPTTAAFSIGVNAPDFTGDGTNRDYDPQALELDQTSTITINMENDGLVDATGLQFFAPLPEGLTLDSFSVDGTDGDIDGNPVDAGDLETGIDIGDVAVNTSRQIELVVRSSGEPVGGTQWVISPTWSYDYISCVGEDPLTEPFLVTDVIIDYVGEAGTTTGDSATTGDDSTSDSASDTDVDPTTASASDTATATDGDTDSDSDGDTAGIAEDDDGCGCRADANRKPAGFALLLLGLAAFRRRRQ